MPITEIALLRLLTGLTPDLRSKLAHAKKVMQDYTSRQMYFFEQIEDPALVYIIGEWESLDQHMNHFLPNEQNQETLKSLEGDIEIQWLLHIDVTHAELPLPPAKADGVINIVRHFMKPSEKDAFKQTFDANKSHLQDYLTEGILGGGWRIDKEDGKEEWVSLCPYASVKQHEEFAHTSGFERYRAIREHLDGVEVKHAKLLDI